MGAKWTRLVELPDGKLAEEVREEHIGGSETQLTYEYYNVGASRGLIDKSQYDLDYWGDIKGIKML